MGKFTTGLFLFFSFVLITFEAQAAGKKALTCGEQAYQQRTCFTTLPGGGCQFGIEFCETASLCTTKKGTWDEENKSCTPPGFAPPKVEVAQKKCSTLGGTYDSSKVCRCPNGKEIDRDGDVGQCSDTVAVDPAKCKELGGVVSKEFGNCWCNSAGHALDLENNEQCKAGASTAASDSPDACAALTKLESDVEACSTLAKKAMEECKQTKTGDKGLDFSKQLLSTFSSAALQAKAGSGQTTTCAEVGLLGSTVLNSMDMFKSTCDGTFASCQDACSSVKDAVAAANGANGAVAKCREAAATTGASDNITKRGEALQASFKTANSNCSDKAAQEKNTVDTLMGDLAKSTTQAKICECKKVTGSTACANVPSAADCLVGGSLYGTASCQVYGDCSLGSTNYASTACQCQRDSSLSICKTADASTLSNFAGIDSSKTSAAAASGVSAGSGATGDNLDLGGFTAMKAAATSTDPATNPLNPGLGAGGGGNGGGGASAPNADLGGGAGSGAAPEEGGSTSGGVFGQIKSAFGFGGAASKTAATGASGGKNNPDLAKWLKGEKRCIASVDECKPGQVGSKNRDIFDVMKSRYTSDVLLDPYLSPTNSGIIGPRD